MLKTNQEIQRRVYTGEIEFLDTALVYDSEVNKCLYHSEKGGALALRVTCLRLSEVERHLA